MNKPIIINEYLTIKSRTIEDSIFEKVTDLENNEINRYLYKDHVYEFVQEKKFHDLKPKFFHIEIHLLNNYELAELIFELYFGEKEKNCEWEFIQKIMKAQTNYLVILLSKLKFSMRNKNCKHKIHTQ